MTKAELKKLMDKHCIISYELDEVIDFVAELLYMRRKEISIKEPYAYRTIDSLFYAEHEVYDLIDYISELEDK